jgi:hypothetical protein
LAKALLHSRDCCAFGGGKQPWGAGPTKPPGAPELADISAYHIVTDAPEQITVRMASSFVISQTKNWVIKGSRADWDWTAAVFEGWSASRNI